MQSLLADRTERRMTCNTFNVTRRLMERLKLEDFKPEPDGTDAKRIYACNAGRKLSFLEIKEIEKKLGCSIKLIDISPDLEKWEYRIERKSLLTPEQGMVLLEHGLEVIY